MTSPRTMGSRDPIRSATRPGDRGGDHDQDGCGQEPHARLERRVAEQVLEVDRQEKKEPIIAKLMISATVLAPMKLPATKNSKSTIGALTRDSVTRKTAVATTPTTSRPMIRDDPQPQSFPSISARTNEVSATVSRTTPR